jgi:hypothetical protein
MFKCKITINSAVMRAFQRCMGRGGVRVILERYVSRTVFWHVYNPCCGNEMWFVYSDVYSLTGTLNLCMSVRMLHVFVCVRERDRQCVRVCAYLCVRARVHCGDITTCGV